MEPNNNENEKGNNSNNVNQEYSTIERYYSTLNTSRLAFLSFFLIAMGFIVKDKWPLQPHLAILGIAITLFFSVFDFRCRIILHYVAERGKRIEREIWKLDKKDGLFSRLYPDEEINVYYTNLGSPIEKEWLFWKKIKNTTGNLISFSHSWVFMILYTVLILYFGYSLFVSFNDNQSRHGIFTNEKYHSMYCDGYCHNRFQHPDFAPNILRPKQ